jgi:hypothetical protein
VNTESFYPDDERNGFELATELGSSLGTRLPIDVHTRACASWPGSACDCPVPDLHRRLNFAFGLVAGMWSGANRQHPANLCATDHESGVHRARTSTLEEVLRVLAHAVTPDWERNARLSPTPRTESPA